MYGSLFYHVELLILLAVMTAVITVLVGIISNRNNRIHDLNQKIIDLKNDQAQQDKEMLELMIKIKNDMQL